MCLLFLQIASHILSNSGILLRSTSKVKQKSVLGIVYILAKVKARNDGLSAMFCNAYFRFFDNCKSSLSKFVMSPMTPNFARE